MEHTLQTCLNAWKWEEWGRAQIIPDAFSYIYFQHCTTSLAGAPYIFL